MRQVTKQPSVYRPRPLWTRSSPNNCRLGHLAGHVQRGNWRIFVIHGFDSQSGTYQPVPIANVTAAMSNAVSSSYWAEGITNVGAYWQGQKLISASATTSPTWTLRGSVPRRRVPCPTDVVRFRAAATSTKETLDKYLNPAG